MACIQRFHKLINLSNVLLQKRFLAAVVQETQEDVTLEYLKDADKGVSVMKLNRMKQRNALSVNLTKDINRVLDEIINASATRVLIIKSTVPGIFCAGADLKERRHLPLNQATIFSNNLRALMNRIHYLPFPVIAAMDGSALGGGLELALACDIRVVTKTAKLGLVETRLAIIPGAGGTARLPRLINPAIAKEMIFTAKIIDGSEALQLGMVNHAVDKNEEGNAAYQKSLDIAKQILPNGPLAVKLAKFAVNRGSEVDINGALAIEEACYAQTIPTKDRMEGVIAFGEKRTPKYTGE